MLRQSSACPAARARDSGASFDTRRCLEAQGSLTQLHCPPSPPPLHLGHPLLTVLRVHDVWWVVVQVLTRAVTSGTCAFAQTTFRLPSRLQPRSDWLPYLASVAILHVIESIWTMVKLECLTPAQAPENVTTRYDGTRLPRVMIIGAQKAATTSLWFTLVVKSDTFCEAPVLKNDPTYYTARLTQCTDSPALRLYILLTVACALARACTGTTERRSISSTSGAAAPSAGTCTSSTGLHLPPGRVNRMPLPLDGR